MSHTLKPSNSFFSNMPSDVACRCLILVSVFLCVLLAIFLQSQHQSAYKSSFPAPDPNLYYKPVIGILTHPGDGASGRLSNATGVSYIAASYVKLIESAGARVIPLIYNRLIEDLDLKIKLVNGVLFTGGWAKTGPYFEIVKHVFKRALARNRVGDHFPVYAINLGFELLTMIVSEDNDILEHFNALSLLSTLHFSENATIKGTVFQSFAPDLLEKLETDCLVQHTNRCGISPTKFQNNPKLSSFFQILTTSKDRDDKVFVSTAHAKNFPVTVSQWHPEKNAFEWAISGKQPHTEDAIRVTQSVANFFVREASKSLNRPDAQEVRDNLIYNYVPNYGGKAGKGYDQVYLFEIILNAGGVCPILS